MRKLYIVIFIIFSTISITAKPSRFVGSISGYVNDAKTKAPLVGVNIYIPSIKRGTTTDLEGYFKISQLHEGMYTLTFSYVGYATITRTVVLESSDHFEEIKMIESVLQLPSVTVTAKPQATDLLSSIQSTAVLEGRDLLVSREQTLGKMLESIPGVTTLTTGTSIAKPVIRGMTGQRVIVLQDGVRQEGQQWGDEHAPEIDVFDIERIEIVRGPGSLLYGSDAIGGVVHVIRPHLKSVPLGEKSFDGKLHLNGFSNTKQLGGSLALEGARGTLGYRGTVSARNSDNYTSPAGIVPGTGFEEFNGSLSAGTHKDWGYVEGSATLFRSTLDIFEEDSGISPTSSNPYQEVAHSKVDVRSSLILEGIRLEGIVSGQRNTRKEFEEGGDHAHSSDEEASLEIVTDTYSLDLKAHHRPFGKFVGTLGASFFHQNVRSLRAEKLVPNSDMTDFSFFIFEEYIGNRLTISGGLRFDQRSLEIERSDVLQLEDHQLRYQAFTGSLGSAWRVTNNLALIGSFTSGWRAPIPFELFSNGVHHGASIFFMGDGSLKPEVSRNLELSLRYASSNLKTDVTIFRNSIRNFIRSFPTGSFDLDSGLPIYKYNQAQSALFEGIEFSLRAQVARWLYFDIGIDALRGIDEEKDLSLSRIPASRLMLGVRLEGKGWRKISHPYVEIKSRIVNPQNNVAAFESASPGYTIIDIGLGFDYSLTDALRLKTALVVGNIFDRSYIDHLNRLKPFGVLNPGRDVALKLFLPIHF